MIITSSTKLEVGKIYNETNQPVPFEYLGKLIPHYSIHVIREATKEEFDEHNLREFPGYDILHNRYYYEIQTD